MRVLTYKTCFFCTKMKSKPDSHFCGRGIVSDACYDRYALLFFSEVSQSGSSRPFPKTGLEKNKNRYEMKIPMD